MEAGTGEPERLPGEFALPGLVDAHCHLTVTDDEQGPYLGDAALADERLALLARTGVTAVRDVGGRREVTLRLGTSVSSGQPRVFAAGRFFAPRSRYFPRMHDPVEPAELLSAVEGEIAEGAGWIKLIGDFPALGEDGAPIPGTTEATYSPELVRQVVDAAHRLGARVAVHTNHAVVRDLVAAGIDSVEHGGSLTADDLSELGARRGAWTPTLEASIGWSPAGSGGRSGWRADRSRQLCELLPLAVERGVQVLAGSDVVGAVHREVALLVEHGLSVEAALHAATVGGHDYLGSADTGDLVTYDRDPRDDPAILATPAAVVIRGTRVH